MLTTYELMDWLNGLVPLQYYANDFPSNSPASSAIVRLSASPPPSEWSNVVHPAFQVIVRGPPDDAAAETAAHAILRALHNKIEFPVAGKRVVHCISEQSTPFYLGQDENQRPLYSLNFEMTMQM